MKSRQLISGTLFLWGVFCGCVCLCHMCNCVCVRAVCSCVRVGVDAYVCFVCGCGYVCMSVVVLYV